MTVIKQHSTEDVVAALRTVLPVENSMVDHYISRACGTRRLWNHWRPSQTREPLQLFLNADGLNPKFQWRLQFYLDRIRQS